MHPDWLINNPGIRFIHTVFNNLDQHPQMRKVCATHQDGNLDRPPLPRGLAISTVMSLSRSPKTCALSRTLLAGLILKMKKLALEKINFHKADTGLIS